MSVNASRVSAALLLVVFLAAFAVTTTAIVQRLYHHPYGDWDAWSMWNVRAKYLAGGPSTWRHAVAPELIGKHSDYPLLLPSVVGGIWRLTGDTPTVVPRAVALGSFLAVVALVVGGLAALRSLATGLIAGTILVANKIYAGEATSQYADVPLSLLFVAAILCLLQSTRARFAAAAGLFASLAAWTKDEGIVFLALCGVACAIVGGGRRVAAYAAGAAPVSMAVAGFKLFIAPAVATPLGTQSLADLAAKALDPTRYSAILSRTAAHFPEIAAPVLLLALLLLVQGVSISRSAAGVWLVVALQWMSYCVVFLLSQPDLGWMLNQVNRLLCQLWPSFVVATMVCLRPVGGRAA